MSGPQTTWIVLAALNLLVAAVQLFLILLLKRGFFR
jgi:hypothetical protein